MPVHHHIVKLLSIPCFNNALLLFSWPSLDFAFKFQPPSPLLQSCTPPLTLCSLKHTRLRRLALHCPRSDPCWRTTPMPITSLICFTLLNPLLVLLSNGIFFHFKFSLFISVYSFLNSFQPANWNLVASSCPRPSRGATLRRRYVLVKSCSSTLTCRIPPASFTASRSLILAISLLASSGDTVP